jgi:hypothetical protein
MATYIKGVTDEYGEIVPYTPNWQFLTAAYATGQARYDRGFNMVKNLYSSVLNSSLTNGENEQFRSDMFRKLQKSLHSVAGVDLSNPTNVMRAKSLLDPISQDEDLIYDIHATRHHQKQKAIMEQYKNSTDPDKRAMYSDYSAMDIAFAEGDLRNAKRGDGSIQSVAPRDFTPFEDVNKFLREAAKEAGLGIKYTTKDPKNPAYLYKIENGQKAYMPFTSWAMGVMGSRFDRQFDVMGRVSGENKIRGMMKEQGISREDAVGIISKDLAAKVHQEKSDEAEFSMSNLAQVENKIETYKRLYKDGFPDDKPEVKEEYMELLQAREELEKTANNSTEEARKIQEDPNYVANNIYSYLTQGARQSTAMDWATGYADSTAKVDMEADQVYLTKMRIASSEKMAMMKMRQSEDHFQQKMSFELQKAKNKGEMPDEQLIGQYTAKGEEGAAYTGVETLEASYAQTRKGLHNKVFAAEKGLINLALSDPKEYGIYAPVIAKVKKISEGSATTLTEYEEATLREYYRKVSGTDMSLVAAPQSAAEAVTVLDEITLTTYNFASEKLSMYPKSGKSTQAQKYHAVFDGVFSDVRTLVQQRGNIVDNYEKIAEIAESSDAMKEIFEDAPVIGYTSKGSKIYDLSGLDESERQYLTENVLSMKGVEVEYNASKLDNVDLKALNRTNLQGLFGKQMKVSYDPATQDAILTVSVDINSKEAKALKMTSGTEEMTLRVPYDVLTSRRSSLGRLATYADVNTVNPVSYGLFDSFASNSDATVNAPTYMKNSGFDWSVTGSFDEQGRKGLLFQGNVYNPETKKSNDLEPRFFAVDFGNPDEFVKVSQTINDIWTQYGMSLAMFDN